MPGSQVQQSRNGAKSCVECRRRKVRCIRLSDDSPTCRRCEERGSECIAQTYRPRDAQRVSSRHRITQLETQVRELTRNVRTIQSKLENQVASQKSDTETPIVNQYESSEGDLSDVDMSSASSDIIVSERPAYLRSLFQNSWLSLGSNQENERIQNPLRGRAPVQLDIARRALHKLIPSKNEVRIITGSSAEWLNVVHTLLPHPFVANSGQEILESYDYVCHPEVDTIDLASWLITFAITAQQAPQEYGNSTSPYDGEKWLKLARAVFETVERKILSHDRLIGTLQGIVLSIQWSRLQMGQGFFKKAWISLRRTIAIAELIGLPRAARSIKLSTKSGASQDQSNNTFKVQLWETICSADRLLGMILNLPADTRWTTQIRTQEVLVNGAVQPRAYMSRLVDIASKIKSLDDLNLAHMPSSALSASTDEIIMELRTLYRQAPESWWERDTKSIQPEHIMQFLHHYIVLRTYLPLAMRQNSGHEYFDGWPSCIDACHSVVQRYLVIRRVLPPGFFLSGIQVFTATVVLILISHSSLSIKELHMHTSKSIIEQDVRDVIQLMHDRSTSCSAGSRFAQIGVSSLRSLNDVLRDDGSRTTDNEQVHLSVLDVPLLGRVHIRRNFQPGRARSRSDDNSLLAKEGPSASQYSSEQGLPRPMENPVPPPLGTDPNSSYAQEYWQWDTLSWYIEDNQEDTYQLAMSDNTPGSFPFQG